MEILRLPIGEEDFKDIITKNYYYVDKTLYVKELINLHGKVNLFTRPRRWGKTLNISTIKYFFEKTKDDNSFLFDKLKIGEDIKCMEDCGKYPVISLSLKGGKQSDFELSLLAIKRAIASEFRRHEEAVLAYEKEKKRITRILEAEGDIGDYIDSIQLLTNILYQFHEEKVIVLIDEYDVPLENSYFQGFYEQMTFFIRSLLESALKTNEALDFAVLTGCLRVAKESIFTGLNNLNIISVLNEDYSEHFGFTELEVQQMLEYYHLAEKMDIIKEWYNGYIIGKTKVYNPWSVIKYVYALNQNVDANPMDYWGNTSSNEIIRELINDADVTTRDEIEVLIKGGSITKQIHEDITNDEIHLTMDNMWNFLFFTGYLKKIDDWMEPLGDRYMKLEIPNKEVSYIFRNKISAWFQEKVANEDLNDFYIAVLDGQAGEMQRVINRILGQSISYMDAQENFYHGFVLGLFSGLKDYRIKSNRESGNGRSDIIIKYMNFLGKAVIIECKYAKSSKDLESKCQEALEQIDEMQYDHELKEEGYKEILKYGICFYKKVCLIKN